MCLLQAFDPVWSQSFRESFDLDDISKEQMGIRVTGCMERTLLSSDFSILRLSSAVNRP